MAPLPQFSTCCGCWSLETGVKIIGIFQIIAGVLGSLIYATVVVFSSLVHEFTEDVVDENDHLSPEDYKRLSMQGAIHSCFGFIIYLYILVCGLILRKGIFEGERHKIVNWLTLTKFYFMLIPFFVIIFVLLAIFFGGSFEDLIECIIFPLLQIYFFIAVKSYISKSGTPTLAGVCGTFLATLTLVGSLYIIEDVESFAKYQNETPEDILRIAVKGLVHSIFSDLLFFFILMSGIILTIGIYKLSNGRIMSWISLTTGYLLIIPFVILIRCELVYFNWDDYFLLDMVFFSALEVYFLMVVKSYSSTMYTTVFET